MKKVPTFPPGGAYKVGGLNGLTGGYYYGYNESPTLQTEIIGMGDDVGVLHKLGQTLAPGVVGNAGIEGMRGGRKYRKYSKSRRSRSKSRKSRKHSKRNRKGSRTQSKRNRKHRKHERKHRKSRKSRKLRKHRKSRKSRKLRRSIKGGSGLRSLIPTDVVELSRNMGHGMGGIYRGMMGEKPTISPDVMVQPIDR